MLCTHFFTAYQDILVYVLGKSNSRKRSSSKRRRKRRDFLLFIRLETKINRTLHIRAVYQSYVLRIYCILHTYLIRTYFVSYSRTYTHVGTSMYEYNNES